MLLADHEGVHEASTHLRIEGLLQAGKQPQVVLLVCFKRVRQEPLVSDKGAEPGEVVENLQERKRNISVVATPSSVQCCRFEALPGWMVSL